MNGDSELTRRRLLRAGAGALGASALSGCTALGRNPVFGPDPNQLRYAQVLAPKTLDPVVADDPYSLQVASLVHRPLYAFDRDLKPVPVLAKGEPTKRDGGTTYVVELRDDARFQSGRPVTAEDVQYSFEAVMAERTRPYWQVDMISSVSAPDDRTVEFSLDHPYPAFEHTLGRLVVPKAERRADPRRFGREDPQGAGPYRVEQFEPGKFAVLTAWDDYWGGTTPAIDRVEMVPNHAGLARTMSLRSGQNDVVERIEAHLWEPTKRFPGTRVARVESYNTFFVGFNATTEPMANPAVREAVDYLVDLDEFVRRVVAPTGRRQYSPLPPQLAEAWGLPVEEWKEIPHSKNVEEAKRLFDRAGVGSWAPKVAVPGTDSSGSKLREKLAEEIVHGLKEAGFSRARTEKLPWPTFRETVTTGNAGEYAMYVGEWAGFDDPDAFLYPLVHENNEGRTNGTYYQNRKVMARIRKARETTDRRRRKRLYESAITTILEDRAYVPAFTLDNTFGVKSYVEGFEPHPLAGKNPELVSRRGGVSLRN